ncbi:MULTISPECIES: heavy metal translocating P-type ATPase [Methanobrevibacter]|uniref:heavy metal translocating P-type ATPase n=1 Tax=Methanobrevibacter TaxID=2172 RepID=UPI0003348E8D|nr:MULTISPECIES: heavy metal translocating P-type ATPase [Methanobrevibacter]AGN16452.1 ATPase [Methanobrevibacter sp. AbM4]MDD6257405.1 heavy metal translocating P-type ATPase [Methanobrevibacter boviskoreani]MDY5614841.1 heavy metal translocating P-type ATPase [Methanobrevibacter boviskoreani]
MKYQIVYDNQTRLRVRSGKNAFTEYEGYGLSELLLENDFIKDVRTSHRNGSILINYYNIEDKDKILRILDNIGMEDLFEGKPSPKNESNEITNKFYLKIIKKLIKRYLIRPFLPLDIRNAITLIKAVKYIAKGLDSLTSFRIDVDLLDGSAVTGSLLKKDFEPASSMMFLLSISDLLEEYTVQKSKSTFKESLSLNIDTVWLVRDDGTEITYPLADIKKGDKVKIHMGDMIPVDGKIVDGEGMINESSMTGEPLAVHKDIGKTVNAGTVLEEGNIVIEVYSVDQDTRLNNIVELIENSENLKAETESKAVELANSLVPYSFVLTFLTYLFTRDTTKALSVLMVDFSCAIKLTTPLSIISAMREASDNRMMIKGGKFIEKFATADTIVFDKTGTLTHASPKVVDVIPTGNYTRDEVLKMSACIEEHFAHSIAKAIVKQAEAEGLNHKEEHSEVEYIVAHGIATRYNDKRAVIGSKHFLFEDEKVEITEEQKKLIDEKVKENSVIYLAIDNKLEGLICINDPVRDEAKDVITRLKTMGIENIIMLTGDSESGARSIAESIGITNYKSQVLPEDKANIIEGLKEEGKTIIMVGDGINDSPALAAADVSVSMKNSSDIAREVADISLLSDNLYDLITLRILSRKMLDKINSNYHKIVGINGTLIALGILGIITPSTSSTIHNLSTMLLGIASTKSVLRDKDKMLNPANDEIKPINA